MWAIDKRKRKRVFEKSGVPVPGILTVPGTVHVDPNRKTFTFTFYNFYNFYNFYMFYNSRVTTEKIEWLWVGKIYDLCECK